MEIALHSLPNDEARRLASSGAPAWLFVNPVEYHGPHLSLDNDRLVSRGLAADLNRRLAATHPDWPFLDAGELGMGSGAVPGPGSRRTPWPRLRDQVVDACRSLATLGVRRAVLMTFHGDPMHSLALEAGARELRRAGAVVLAPMHLLLREILTLGKDGGLLAPAIATVADPDRRRGLLDGIGWDLHAGFLETSLTLHYAPDTVSQNLRDVPDCPPWTPAPEVALLAAAARRAGRTGFATEAAYAAMGVGWLRLRPFPGYTGRPSLANAEAGRILADVLVDRFAEAAEAVLVRGAPAPRPVMTWLEPLLAGGRLY